MHALELALYSLFGGCIEPAAVLHSESLHYFEKIGGFFTIYEHYHTCIPYNSP